MRINPQSDLFSTKYRLNRKGSNFTVWLNFIFIEIGKG